jgi:hydrogenase maturation protein HypF
MVRRTYLIRGIVQGVGFRPTVHRLAQDAGLGGFVQNRAGSVWLTLEGPSEIIHSFIQTLPSRLPPQARLDTLSLHSECPLPDAPPPAFRIIESVTADEIGAVLPPDAALCPPCRTELFNPDNRRFGYPFITCADCGPRYTLIHSPPYDRERTTMSDFPLCPDCQGEYTDPANRRFHAESIACPVCGPHLTLADAQGQPLPDPALPAVRAALAAGRIVAIKGIGGFHLAVDAGNRTALQTLRNRKKRPAKPFAIMADSLDTIRQFCVVPPAASDLLESPQAPIVILDLLPDAPRRLPIDLISPDSSTLGVFLPTSPLHELLFHPLPGDLTPPFPCLIMTSGNRGGEPICITEDEAIERLKGIADLFLFHNRPINRRNDDSICVIRRNRPQIWRRARGFAPVPIPLTQGSNTCVLALGAEIKNTVALRFDDCVVLSPHIGDLETPEAVDSLEQTARALPVFFKRTPGRIAVDAHPDFHSTRLGVRLGREWAIPVLPVQHHHAHALACLREHHRSDGWALVLDGSGWGPDQTVWGAELLEVSVHGYRRWATFAPAPLPGGDAAVRHPLRQLIARRWAAGIDPQIDRQLASPSHPEAVAIWQSQCQSGAVCPRSRSAGRLFDAVAALLGLAPDPITYEGQAAIRLEAAARRVPPPPSAPRWFVAHPENKIQVLDWSPLFLDLADLDRARQTPEILAAQFHVAMAEACLCMVQYALASSHHREVALSGGVFMNQLLTDRVVEILDQAGIKALIHHQTPPNDGCIALGQALMEG